MNETENWQADLETIDRHDRTARALLKVPRDADGQRIRSAYRKACLAFHPDRNPDDPDAARHFRLIRCAYLFLVRGEDCPELDEWEPETKHFPHDDRYNLDNPWGYFCWWQDVFF